MTATPVLAWIEIVRFVGSKTNHGLPHAIINLVPPHETWIEPFAGLAAIANRKRPAAETILVDLKRDARLCVPPGAVFILGCAFEFLRKRKWTGREVVYVDPPYVLSTRGGRIYYAHELTDAEHVLLLQILISLPPGVRVILSGYHCEIYDVTLNNAGWNFERFETWTQNHKARTEVIWFNFPRPDTLHEYGLIGQGWRERQRIQKKVKRWSARLARQDALERAALFSSLVDVMGAAAVRAAVDVAELAREVPPRRK